ncbi:MAG TPA: hypothetical protein VHN80_29440, partial [Kineosporiaceae bacterium]|nr:hypothetical protein [Kineosporiaceae bacterium]
MGQHEEGHLELVLADVPVRVLGHLERPLPHENGTGFLDHGVHVGGAPQGRKIGVEAARAAVL